MSRKRWKKPGAALLAAGIVVLGIGFRAELAAWFLGRDAPGHSDAAHYTCSMDPSVRAEGPGKCPICGMTLTPVSQADLASDVLHIPPDGMLRIRGSFAAVEKKTLRKRLVAYGQVAEPAEGKGGGSASIQAEAYEIDPSALRPGQTVSVRLPRLPLEGFEGSITDVRVDDEAKSTHLRVTVADVGKQLQPGMHAEVRTEVDMIDRLVVPAHAVIPAGSRRIVFVDRKRERLEPRQLKIGVQSDGLVEVLGGLSEGERVLVSGNFLVAAESRIRSGSTLWAEPKPKPRKRPTEPNPGGKPKPGEPGGPPVKPAGAPDNAAGAPASAPNSAATAPGNAAGAPAAPSGPAGAPPDPPSGPGGTPAKAPTDTRSAPASAPGDGASAPPNAPNAGQGGSR
jgi:hypothetical protein